MDYQITINKDRNIGNVVYVLEGNKTEKKIFNSIFTDLGYKTISNLEKNRRSNDRKISDNIKQINKIKKKNNEHSTVYFVTVHKNQLTKISESEKYLDKVLSEIENNYNIDLKLIENANIYYIFDRDEGQYNNNDGIRDVINEYSGDFSDSSIKKSRHGLLSISYPFVESYYHNVVSDYSNESDCFIKGFTKGTNTVQNINLSVWNAILMINLILIICVGMNCCYLIIKKNHLKTLKNI